MTLASRPFVIPALIAVLAGVGLVAAFAPLNLWPLAVLSPAVLLLVWSGRSPGQAWWLGFAFGLGYYGVGVSWVFNSIYEFGQAPLPFAAALTTLFVLVLALYPALTGWIHARFERAYPSAHALRWVVFLPAIWVLGEGFRGWFLTGFPWLWLGYSQVSSPLGGVAPVLGTLGVSWIVMLLAGLLVFALRVRGPLRWRALGGGLVVVLAAWGAGQIRWTESAGKPIQAVLIQGNIQQDNKWDQDWLIPTVERYLELTHRNLDVDLIVWPEAALPGRYHIFKDSVLEPLRAELRDKGVDLLLGILYKSERGTHNSILKQGEDVEVYHKRHLVPFGEYIPLRDWLNWLGDMVILPAADITPGSEATLLTAAGQPVAASICYEAAYGAEMADRLPQATLLVNVSNDAWFGDSFAPWQHLQIAQMRALELGRPMLRATNSGISAMIDHRGKVLVQSPQFKIAVVHGDITPQQGATPFVRFRHWPVLSLAGLLVLLAGAYARYARTRVH
ncbi:MAG: apolipoprotein N-acyltransferase [Thiotrichales bacterium]